MAILQRPGGTPVGHCEHRNPFSLPCRLVAVAVAAVQSYRATAACRCLRPPCARSDSTTVTPYPDATRTTSREDTGAVPVQRFPAAMHRVLQACKQHARLVQLIQDLHDALVPPNHATSLWLCGLLRCVCRPKRDQAQVSSQCSQARRARRRIA